jgi:CRP/FNR family transcriptional regulator, cyclic AMP receptor protein
MVPFDELDKEMFSAIESIAVTRSYPKNTVIISQGDESDAFYQVLSGSAAALIIHEDGRQIVLARFKPGDFFGEMSCLDGEGRSATVQTKEPTRCLVISRAKFHHMCGENPSLIWALIRNLIRRLRRSTRKIEELAFMNVYGRVTRYLCEMQQEEIIEQQLTHQEIAHNVGASREMVSRIMKELAVKGYIDQARGRIRILRDLPFDNGDF